MYLQYIVNSDYRSEPFLIVIFLLILIKNDCNSLPSIILNCGNLVQENQLILFIFKYRETKGYCY